uniref:Uncharacterized protein n=1 Tax=Arundo donax TaxID=35708 RepID=A0A0A9AIT5_ARUDO
MPRLSRQNTSAHQQLELHFWPLTLSFVALKKPCLYSRQLTIRMSLHGLQC